MRTIRPEFSEPVFEFLNSNFYRRAVERGDMVASYVEDGADGLRLIHPRVRIAAYPWEWTASQWLAAAQLTLRLCDEALDEGWILKDATPLNVLFDGLRGRCWWMCSRSSGPRPGELRYLAGVWAVCADVSAAAADEADAELAAGVDVCSSAMDMSRRSCMRR